MKYWNDEAVVQKINAKMRGVPTEVLATLKKISDTSLSMHEAARRGDMKGVLEYLKKNQPIDAQDLRGITPLGYAVGSNRAAVVKALLDAKANPQVVDVNHNTGLHYAAGYGC